MGKRISAWRRNTCAHDCQLAGAYWAKQQVGSFICFLWCSAYHVWDIGLPIPDQTDGISLLPTLLNNSQKKKHEYLYWEFPAYNGQQAVRLGKWKGIRKDIFDGNMDVELYDLDNDIQEQNNLATQYPEVVEKIEAIMKQEHIPSTLEKFKFSQLGDK